MRSILRVISGNMIHTIAGMVFLCIVLSAPAGGQLKISDENPRYFADGNRKAILMTGSHTWNNRQDVTLDNDNHILDFTAYLKWMKHYNHNFIRMWVWEQSKWHPHMECGFLFQPTIYMRTGPGNALDGSPRFDVTEFNQEFFDRLRSRVIEAGKNGIYVSVMLFEGWSIEEKYQKKENPWNAHPFHRDNNINGIDGDANGDGQGLEIHTLMDDPGIQVIRKFQEAYIKKVIDAVNDLNNVMYEISNESHGNSVQWQYYMINFIKSYEASSKQKRHLVWMTSEGGSNVITNEMLFNSPADVISPNSRGGYIDDPPADTRNKIVISDTDHLWGVGGIQAWVWKSFTRGLHPIFMDPYDAYYWSGFGRKEPSFDLKWEPVRRSMGYVRQYSEQMDLVRVKPCNELASTSFCLANPGVEYLIYQPLSDSEFTVNLTPWEYHFEWFHPSSGKIIDSGTRTFKTNVVSFKAAIPGDVILYLKAAGRDQKGSSRIREKIDFGWMF